MEQTPKYIAGLTETRGEHVTRALRNVFDRMCQLEKEKKEAKHEADLTHSRKDATTQSLREAQATHAAAEARCNLLELQLHHIRTLLGRSLDGIIWDDIQTETKIISTAADTFKSKSHVRKTVSKTSQESNRDLKSQDTSSRETVKNQHGPPNLTPLSSIEQSLNTERERAAKESSLTYDIDSALSNSVHYCPSAPPIPNTGDDVRIATLPHNINPLNNSEQRPNSSLGIQHTQSCLQPIEFANVNHSLQDTLEEPISSSSCQNTSGPCSSSVVPGISSEGLFSHSRSTNDIIPIPSDEFNHKIDRPNLEIISENCFHNCGNNSNTSGMHNHVVDNAEVGPQYGKSMANDFVSQSALRLPAVSTNLNGSASEHPLSSRSVCSSEQYATGMMAATPEHITGLSTTDQLISGSTTYDEHANVTTSKSINLTGTSAEGSAQYNHSGQYATDVVRTTPAQSTGTLGQDPSSLSGLYANDTRNGVTIDSKYSPEGLCRRPPQTFSRQYPIETLRAGSTPEEDRQIGKFVPDVSPVISANLTGTVKEEPVSSRSLFGTQHISISTPIFSSGAGGTVEEGPLSSRSIHDNSIPCITSMQKDGTVYHTKNELVRSYEHKRKLSTNGHPAALEQNQHDNCQTIPKVIDEGVKKTTSRSKSRQSSKNSCISKKPAPFILGKSTGESHSVPANMQNVRNILKNGSGKLRSPSNVGSQQEKSARSSVNVNGTNVRYSSDFGSTREDIKEVMCQLEEEKAIILLEIFRCQNLLNEARHPSLAESMIPELNTLKQRLKAKTLQIARLNTLLEMIGCPSKQQRCYLQTATLSKDKPGHLFVTTEITTRPSGKSIEVQTTMTKVSKTPERLRNSELNSNRQFLHELRDIKHSLQEN